MAKARTPRSRWLEAGLAALAEGGPAAVRVEELARRLGVTKGGFYGYFAGRADLLDAMLDHWEAACTQEVADRVTLEGLQPGAAAMRAAQLTWRPGWLLDVDLAVRDWARREPSVAARLERVDRYRVDFLREQLGQVFTDPVEAEARSLLAYAATIGTHYAGLPLAAFPAEARARVFDILIRQAPDERP
jgi:AcrR family transcriptional regulator